MPSPKGIHVLGGERVHRRSLGDERGEPASSMGAVSSRTCRPPEHLADEVLEVALVASGERPLLPGQHSRLMHQALQRPSQAGRRGLLSHQ
jgi:hypothetical protein